MFLRKNLSTPRRIRHGMVTKQGRRQVSGDVEKTNLLNSFLLHCLLKRMLQTFSECLTEAFRIQYLISQLMRVKGKHACIIKN